MIVRRWMLPVLVVACLTALAGEVIAAPRADMQVSAEVVGGCEVAAGQWGALDYGTRAALDTEPVAASLSSTVQIRCTPGMQLSMQVDGGQHGRQLQRDGGGERIPYQLFSDAARGVLLPIDQSVPVPLGGAGVVTLPIHAELSVPAHSPAGMYSDVLQVQLIW